MTPKVRDPQPPDISPFNPDDANSWAFPADCPDPASSSPIDLRFLNEPVAGANGPLRLSPDGNDLLYADGRPFRGWMTHHPLGYDYDMTVNTWSYADHQRCARFLARLGVNAVILGNTNTGERHNDPARVNPVVLECVHRTVAACRQEGIYSQLRMGWFYVIQGQQLGVEAHRDLDLQCLVFFHPRVQEVWKAWARELLTTVNPYSGIPLKDDHSLFSVEIVNEDSLLFHTLDSVRGEARREIERQFGAWSAAKYGSAEKALAAWNKWGERDDAPAEGRLGLMSLWTLTRDGRIRANEQRIQDQYRFLVETMANWNRDAKRYLTEELGAKHLLIAASNFIPADRVVMDDGLRLLAWRDAEIIENNHYCMDGGKPAIAGWRVDAGGYMGMHSTVKKPTLLPTNKRQVEGKPFLCTEINWPRPHPFEVEGPLLVSAYQSLNGLDGLAWYSLSGVTWENHDQAYFRNKAVNGHNPLVTFTGGGPARLGQFPAAAAIRRLGLVQEAAPVIREFRTEKQIYERQSPITAEEYVFEPTQFASSQAMDTIIPGGPPKAAFLVGPVRVKLTDEPAAPEVADLSPFIADGVIQSATGELIMDSNRKLFTLNAPAARAVVGFLAAAGAVDLSGVRVESSAEHGTVAVVALDAQPLAESRRILVQVGARCVPTGWKESAAEWEDTGEKHIGLRIEATGDLPWRVQKVRVSVTFDRLAATKATALDGNGNPTVPVALEAIPGGVRLNVPEGVMYVALGTA